MGEPNWQNRTLFVADNLRVMRGMDSESVDCIATDPPFNSKRIHNAPLGSRSAAQRFDDRWRWDEVTDEWHDLIATDHPAIKEIIEAAAVIEGGAVDRDTGRIDTGRVRNSIAAYIAWMAPRVVEMHRLLKPSGVLFMHCDWQANAYLRLLLDALFGRRRFINEVVRRRSNPKGLATRRLPNNHDNMFAYSKGDKWKWRPSFEPYDMQNLDAKTLKQYRKTDAYGRRYEAAPLLNPSKDRPNLTYEFLGVTRVWRWTRERMEAAYAAGRIAQTAPGRVPRYIRYLDEQPGKPRDTMWFDVAQPESSDVEWKTRKPTSLYRRLIECATDIGDMVLDPFAGCATTCVSAEQLQRRWTGIDIDPVAEEVTKERLEDETGINLNETRVIIRKSPIRRTDINLVSDAKLRESLWRSQAHQCANPYCDADNLRSVDLELDHRIPRVRGGRTTSPTASVCAGTATGEKARRRGARFWIRSGPSCLTLSDKERTMADERVLEPSDRRPIDSPEDYARVTHMEVELSPTGQSVVLRITPSPHHGHDSSAFVLSPPAARRLSRRLRKAVKDYLRHAPDQSEAAT